MIVADEASRCAMEAGNGSKEEGIVVMATAIPDPPETRGVEATRTDNGVRNACTVARMATRRASAGRSAPIRREPVLEMSTNEISSVRTTPKDPEKPKKGQPSS